MYGQLKRETGQVGITVLNNGDVTVSSPLRTYDGFKDDDGQTKKKLYADKDSVWTNSQLLAILLFSFFSVDQNQRERWPLFCPWILSWTQRETLRSPHTSPYGNQSVAPRPAWRTLPHRAAPTSSSPGVQTPRTICLFTELISAWFNLSTKVIWEVLPKRCAPHRSDMYLIVRDPAIKIKSVCLLLLLQTHLAGEFRRTSQFPGLHTSKESLLMMTMRLPSASGHTARLWVTTRSNS